MPSTMKMVSSAKVYRLTPSITGISHKNVHAAIEMRAISQLWSEDYSSHFFCFRGFDFLVLISDYELFGLFLWC
jgi:hypothetical protein